MPKVQIEIYIFKCPTCEAHLGAQTLAPIVCPNCANEASFDYIKTVDINYNNFSLRG